MSSKYFKTLKTYPNCVNTTPVKEPEVIEISESPEAVRKRNQMETEIIEVMRRMFPEIDVCEIQDALIESSWSVFNAPLKWRNLYEGTADPKVTQTSATSSDKPKDDEPKVVTNGERMKSMDHYRKNWRAYESHEEEEKPTKSHDFESIKNLKNKYAKSGTSESPEAVRKRNQLETEIIDISDSPKRQSKNCKTCSQRSMSAKYRTRSSKPIGVYSTRPSNWETYTKVPAMAKTKQNNKMVRESSTDDDSDGRKNKQ